MLSSKWEPPLTIMRAIHNIYSNTSADTYIHTLHSYRKERIYTVSTEQKRAKAVLSWETNFRIADLVCWSKSSVLLACVAIEYIRIVGVPEYTRHAQIIERAANMCANAIYLKRPFSTELAIRLSVPAIFFFSSSGVEWNICMCIARVYVCAVRVCAIYSSIICALAQSSLPCFPIYRN